ncbi:hypothetical protein SBA5_690009 [Candidatus Sulfotelmatomonas gaucii]|uniref:Uncharacterized protein n=1 Tax=Candidatus Sulfuritelmatomonas gaucii TaxID=2043161 RepID=A0A2N9LZT6_9BACT|nr:hypothetical protein SBA5_690009 [Candidatus Sulfotelmatomonas gaucii]
MSMDRTIRRVTDLEEQKAETYRYWQSRTVGDRLIAVCELSEAAYAFAAGFKGALAHDDQGLQRSSSRV